MTQEVMLRPWTPAELPQAVAICASACDLDSYHDQILSALVSSGRITTVAFVDDSLVGICLASIEYKTAPGQTGHTTSMSGYLDLIAVDPAWQGGTIGAQLLTYTENLLANAGCRVILVAGSGPTYAWPGVDVRYIRAIGLFEQHGYRRRSVEVNMQVDLRSAPLSTTKAESSLAAASGIVFRSATPVEAPALRESLGRTWKTTWLDEIDAALVGTRSGVEVAIGRDGYLGFCAHGNVRPGVVGPLGTDPRYRGHGIGTALIRRAMRAVAADGHTYGEIVWAGPLSLFSRTLEATISRVFITYTKTLP